MEEGQANVSAFPVEVAVLSASLAEFKERWGKNAHEAVDSLLDIDPSEVPQIKTHAKPQTTAVIKAERTSEHTQSGKSHDSVKELVMPWLCNDLASLNPIGDKISGDRLDYARIGDALDKQMEKLGECGGCAIPNGEV